MEAVHHTTDVAKVDAAAGPWLRRDPVANNPTLAVLASRRAKPDSDRDSKPNPTLGHYWWVTHGDHIAAIALQASPTQPLIVRTDDLATIPALVAAIAAESPAVPGVQGRAAAAAAFAAAWSAHRHFGASVAMLQRFYHLSPSSLLPPSSPPPGQPRLATLADLDPTVVPWAIAFRRQALGHSQAETMADHDNFRLGLEAKITANEVVLWDHDGGPQAMAAAPQPADAVSRLHLVYTPPSARGRGLGAAITTAAAHHAFAAGATDCTLFADLTNPTSNAIYQRLGFRPIGEHLTIHFTPDLGSSSVQGAS